MRFKLFSDAFSTSPRTMSDSNRVQRAMKRDVAKKVVASALAAVAMVFSAGAVQAQSLALNPAVTDLYSKGFVNFASTQVGQSVTQTVQLKVTGAAVTITSIATPAPGNLANGNPSRIKQFTVGTITGCTVGASNAVGTTCSIPVTFTPAYVGYQTSPLVAVTSGGTFQFGLNGVGVGPQAVLMPGILSTVAGNGTVQANALSYTGDGGQATAAQVLSHGFTFDALGNLYEAEDDALVVRKITPAGVISTVAGAETTAGGVETATACAAPANACGDGAAATTANFATNLPDVAFDSAGNYYIADLGDNRVRRVDAVSGIITTIAGTGTNADTGNGGAATSAALLTPEAVAVDYQDNIYLLDSNASQTTLGASVRYIDHATGTITLLAGNGTACAAGGAACGDGGQATAAAIGVSASFYVDPTTGNFWIADRDANRIRFVNRSTGVITTVAGTGAANYTGDGGAATSATFNGPHGIWVDPAGDLYIGDRNNNRVRFVSAATNTVSTLAGGGGTCTAGGNGTCGDGGPSNGSDANLTPDDVRLDVNGNLFIADQQNNAIRKVTQNPTTLTFPTVAVGVTSGPLTEKLVNIGSSTLTYTTPASGSNAAVTTTGPTSTASNAFTQTSATTCGPIFSTSTTGNTLASGATCNYVVDFTPDTAAGNYTGTLIETDNSYNAGAAGNTVYPTAATQVVNLAGTATKATATVGVTTTPNPSYYGQSVAITATLSGAGVAPTGTVTFTYTPTGSTTPVTIGTGTISTTGGVTTASLSTLTLPVGTDSIVATYNGDANYVSGTQSSAVAQVVTSVPVSNDSIAATPNPATTGSTVTIVFTVPNGPTAPSTATSVTFTYTPAGSTTPVTITAGVKGVTGSTTTTYTATTTVLPVGTDTITGTLTGDGNYAGGSLTTTETINAAGAAGDAVTVTTNPTVVESPDTLTFSIPVVSGAAVPTGTVAFSSGSTSLGSATFPATPAAVTCPSGTGTCYTVSVSTTALPLTVSPATSTPVTGTYTSGTGSGYTSGTAATTVVVNQVSGTGDAVSAANATTTVGTADPLTFSIPVVTGAPAPAGTVAFTSGTTNLGSATWPATPTTGTCPSGSGTCYLLADAPSPTNIPLTTGTNTPITATFTASAASGYASAAPTTSVVVNPAGGAGDTVSVANNPTTFGTADAVTFSIPVTSGAPAPAGTVVFTAGGVTLGTATWPANPTATGGAYALSISPTTLPVGSPTTVTATFTATAASGYGSAAPTANVTVNKVPLSNDGISATPSATTSGSTVTLTFSVPNVNNTPPASTATVTFTYNGTTLGTANLVGTTANGTTTYSTTTTALPVGSDTVTGTFAGDGNYAGGALTTPVAISSNTTTDTVAVATNPTTVASPDTITFSIPVTGSAAAPTGSVSFTSGSTTLGTATWSATPVATGGFYTISITTTTLPLTVAPATSTPVLATFTAGTGSGYASATASTTVVVNQVSGTGDAVTAGSSAIAVGTADPLTFSIPVVTGAPVPTGTVTFASGSTNLGSATWPTTPTTGACPTGGGTCYLLADSPSPTNIPLTVAPSTSTPITATYAAGSGSGYASSTASTSVAVSPASGTGDTLTVSNNPTTFGVADPLTFSIPVSSGAPAPAGTVVFTAGGVTLGTATWAANPTATGGAYTLSISPTTLPVGTPTTVTATFTPTASSGYGAAAPTATVTVNKVPLSNDGISATPSATTSGSTVTLSFTVPNVNGTAPASTATVTFSYNGTTLGTANLVGTTTNGTTTYTTTTTALPVGSDTVTGTFTGDGNYAGGALTTPVAISSNTTTDTLKVATNPTTVTSPDVITFSIPVTGSAAAPTGTVAFTSGSTSLGSATWPATPVATGGFYTLSVTTSALPLTVAPSTSTPVLATFTAGTGSGYASATASTTVVVNQVAGTGDAVTAANATTTVGTADPLTFSIPVVAGAPVPTGTVAFTSGSTALGSATWPTTPVTGTCPGGSGNCYLLVDAPSPTNIPLTVSPATSTPITATYTAGAGSGYASAAPATSVDVTPVGGTGGTLTIANNPTTYGTADPMTFSLPVSSGVPAPTGTVVFTAGGVTLGTATWPANPTATGGFYSISISPTNTPVGSPTTVTATFTPGTGSGYGASAPTATVTVNKVPLSNDSITATPNPATSGATVTLTFKVPNVNATVPTGTVTFTYGTTTLGTANLTGTTAGGVTTYTTTTTALPVGTDTVTGTFTGDGDYAGGPLTTSETINQATGTDSVTVATNPTVVASPDVITFSIPVSGTAAAPAGTVVFTSGTTSLGTANWPATPVATGGFYTLSITTSALPLTTAPATSTPVTATFTASGASGYASGTASTTVVVNQVPSAGDALTVANNPTTVGAADPLTFSIPVVAGAPVPTGTVVFASGATGLGTATWPATPVTGACPTGGGTCYILTDQPSPTNIPLTVAPATSTPVTAVYTAGPTSGYSSGTASSTVQVNSASGTGDSLTVANNPTTYGTADALTFSIPVSTGAPAPAGTVVFTAGTTTLGTATWPANPVATGGVYTLSISPTNIPVGSPTTVTATFTPTGASGYGAAAPTATVTVNTVPLSNDSLKASPNPQVFGSTVTLTFSVPNVNGTAPAGTSTVTFSYNGTTLGTAAVTGTTAGGVTTYTTTTTTLPVGIDTVTGTFTGDSNYAGGPLTTTETINTAGTGATLTANPNPTTFGTPVTLTETIVPINGTCPTGPVTFLNNGVSIGTGAISQTGGSCLAVLTTSTLPVGMDAITATVPASGGFSAITSGPVTVQVGKAAGVGDTLTTNPNPSTFGSPVVITETLPTVGNIAPTGTVTFFDNGTSIGTATISGGVATITTSALPSGTDPITATYAGDTNYATVTSGPLNQVVNMVGGSATLAVGPNPATFGTPVTITESITPVNGVCPVGPTTFYNNGKAIGTGVISLTNGSCTATLVTSTLPVGTDSITATVPADSNYVATTTGPVALVVNKANGADTLTSSPNPSVFGNPVTITDTIPTVGGVAPTGTVTFYDFGTAIGTGTVNGSGVATLVTSTLPVGTDSLTATYAGDGNYAQVTTAPVNQVVTAVSTTATLAVGPNPANFGNTVTITETIPVVNGTPATGTVTFFSNGTQIGTGTLANGVATITTTTLPVGTDAITATYPGDGNYSKVSSGPVNETINTANGADTLTVAPDPAIFGSTVTITDTIPTVGGVTPTGTVTFYNNGTAIGTGTVNSSGVATITTTTLPIGTDPITAVYGGDTNYAPVTTGPVNETVTVGNTKPVLGATPNPTTFGTAVTLTEAIPGINGVLPTGTVTFFDNGTQIGTGTLVNGVATLVTSTLPIGTDPITATYSGDSTYATANTGPLNVVVNKATPVDTLTGSPNPSVFGTPVTLTFTVPPVNGVTPTGTVSFYNGTTLLGTGTVNASGIATITTSQLPFGTVTVTATYPGDNNYAPAAPTATLSVSPVSPISVVTVPGGTPACGSAITLTDTITAVNGVPLTGGTVQFYDNGVAIGSPITVTASGVVTLTTTSLPCTTDAITAVYTPPANSPYLPSTGGPVSVHVLTPDFSIAATPANQTVNPGDTTTYTVSLSGVGAPFTSPVTLTATGLPPGATVSFANPTYVPGAGPTSTTMTIVTSPTQALLRHSTGGINGVFYGLLLLPLLGVRRIRRKIRALPKGISYGLAALLLLGGLGAMTGCGGGYFGPTPQTFTITVTGTSGTLVHSTTVTLTVR